MLPMRLLVVACATTAPASRQEQCADTAPPELPIESAAPLSDADPNGEFDFLGLGSPILQGWGNPYQTMLVEQAAANASFVQMLKEDFGFAAVVLSPPGCFGGAGNASVETFHRALTAYRSAGVAIILYTGIINAGNDPRWESGNLTGWPRKGIPSAHPEMAQRHADGTPWLLKFKPALSPASSAAQHFALQRTVALAAAFGPISGVMMDDSEFCPSPGSANVPVRQLRNLCDYSAHAHTLWRQYLTRRFPAEWARRCLGIDDRATARMPVARKDAGTPLFAVWAHWRNVAMAASLEEFRIPLRRAPAGPPAVPQEGAAASEGSTKPVAVVANTELEWGNLALATRLQPAHEDMVLTESYDTGAAAVDKAYVPLHPTLVGWLSHLPSVHSLHPIQSSVAV